MKRYICVLFIVCFSCIVQPVVRAHEDPSGEIYPYVSVENDRFIVYYMVSKSTVAVGEDRSDYYQVAYDKEGNRIAGYGDVNFSIVNK